MNFISFEKTPSSLPVIGFSGPDIAISDIDSNIVDL